MDGLTRVRAAGIAGGTGFALMGLELTAVRLLAPHFGDSAYVWTNVIGVILVALAFGAWFGGRLADRGSRALPWMLAAGAIAAAVVPLVSRPLGSWLLPPELELDAALGAMVRGSFSATLVLFAPVAFCAGAVTPMLVVAVAQQGGVGRASGLVSAAGTLGSLAGTFAATHWLVPTFGCRTTVWACAALLGACSFAAGMRPAAAAALVVLPLMLPALPLGPLRGPLPGTELLAEVESRIQYLQVVRDPREQPPVVALKINEGLDSFHSIAVEGNPWSGGRYYDWHAPLLLLAGAPPQGGGEGLRVLSLGSAAGTFTRLFGALWPQAVVDEVELDPATVALGGAHFGGRSGRGATWAGVDARVFVETAAVAPYDLVLVDCYARQIYVPAHVSSREFFTAVRRLLKPGGIVSVNSGGRRHDDPVVEALSGTMAAVFGVCHRFQVPLARNFVLAARHGLPLDPVRDLPRLAPADPRLAEVTAAMARASAWTTRREAGVALVDDRPFLDCLQHEALAQRGAAAQPLWPRGERDPDAVAADVAGALRRQDPEAALAVAGQASSANAYLRLLIGDARWRLTDFDGASAEYDAALAAQPQAEVATTLRERRATLAALQDGQRRGRRVAARNGWLAAALAAVGLLGAWLGLRLA